LQRNNNEKLELGVLGPKFTFSDIAGDWYLSNFKDKKRLFFNKKLYSYIWEVFEGLNCGEIQHGIVPIENSIYGTVRETLDYLFKSDVKIIQQFSLPIHHCIAVKEGTKRKDITKVISHQQALSQCHDYLRKNYKGCELSAYSSTAMAIKSLMKVHGKGELVSAVICSQKAAKEYKLRILDIGIQDVKSNKTSFVVLARDSQDPSPKFALPTKSQKNIKTSIVFHFTKDSPGTLFSVFKDFNDAKVNMTRIESRPAPKKCGDYLFFLDFEGNIADRKIQKLLKKIEEKVALLKVFGSYSTRNVRL
jgi:prephenate dehydratase